MPIEHRLALAADDGGGHFPEDGWMPALEDDDEEE